MDFTANGNAGKDLALAMNLRDFVQRMRGSYPEESADAWATALEALPAAQQDRLMALLEELRRLTVAEVIMESAKLRCPDPDTDNGRRRLREAMAAGVAVSRILSYLTMLDTLNQQRGIASRQIGWHKARADELLHIDLESMAREMVECYPLSGLIEVDIHLIAICTHHVAKLLSIATRPTGHKISADDRRVLHQFEGLRHHFEHLEERLPGKPRQADIVREIDDESGWGLEVGFQFDAHGRIVIGDEVYDVDNHAISDFDRVARENVVRMRTSAFGEVVLYFIAHPDLIPDPSVIQRKPMLTLGLDFEGGIRA